MSSEETTPVKVKKIGHVVFNVSDLERSTKFWTEIMGFHVSDVNERGMIFLRNASDHHTVALFPSKSNKGQPEADQVAFNHFALEVGSVTELFKIRDFLKAKDVPILYEGRRGAGLQPGSGVHRSRRLPDRALRLHGPDRLGGREPAGRAVVPRHHSRGSAGQAHPRRLLRVIPMSGCRGSRTRGSCAASIHGASH